MNGVIMVFSSIALTTAMSFATVLGRHRRIQRADPSLKKTDFDRNLLRSLYFTPRKIFARAHKRNSGLGYGIAVNIVFFTVTDVTFLTKSIDHVMINDSSHLSHAV